MRELKILNLKPSGNYNLYTSDDIQTMLKHLTDNRHLKEAFIKKMEDVNTNDSYAIISCVKSGWYENFYHYDSDVTEQFISYVEKTIMDKEWVLQATYDKAVSVNVGFCLKPLDELRRSMSEDELVDELVRRVDDYYDKVDSPYEKGIVDIEGEYSHPAYFNKQRWNGWIMPYFTKVEANKIVKECKATGMEISWDSFHDAYKYRQDKEDDWEYYKGTDIQCSDGKVRHLYGIGAASWIWSKAI